MRKILLLLLLLPVLVRGQDFPKEMVFVKNLDVAKWNKILARANKEDKIIYIRFNFEEYNKEYYNKLDSVFNVNEIADYLKQHFICLLIPFRSRFKKSLSSNFFLDSLMPLPKDGQAIFATYFTKNGKRLHKSTIVPYYDADGFVEELNNVVNGKNNYYEMVEEFQAGNRSIDFFKKLMQTARIAHDSVDTYLKVFIETRDNLFTKENGEILMQCNSEKLAFDYMQTNQEIWKQLLGEKVLNNFYKRSVYKEISYSYFYVYDKNITPFFLIKMYDEKYSKLGKLQAITFLIRHLTYERKHIDFNNVIELFIDTSVLKDFENSDLNLLAWNTFQMLADTSILNKALSWSKKSLETDKDNPAYLDTYANLLYKLGHTKEAIEIETKALELIDDKQKKSYQETLDKMKQGKPTLDIK